MPDVRVTYLFNDGRYSWSETHYWLKGGDLLTTVLPRAQRMLEFRLGMMGVLQNVTNNQDLSPQCKAIRVSYDDVWRDSIIDTSYDGVTSQWSIFRGERPYRTPDVPYSSLLLRMEHDRLHRRRMHLSGIPDDVIIDPEGPRYIAGFQAALDAWEANLLFENAWGFKARKRPPEIASVDVQAITSAMNGTITIQANAHGLTGLVQIVLLGARYAKGTPVLRGRLWVTVFDADHLTVRGKKGQITYRGAATIEEYVEATYNYAGVVVVRQALKKRGVTPGYWQVGRSRNRA